jgi:hypothetical protein
LQPTVGRIVTYRTSHGLDVAALIVSTPESGHPTPPAPGYVHLHIFYPRDTPADYVTDEGVPEDALGVKPDGEQRRGHWRWPERV